MCYEQEAQLAQSAMAPSDARRIVRRACSELHVEEELTDTATLLTSELVTNAIKHASGPLQLGVSCTQGRLVVSVQDSDPRPPQLRRVRNRAVGGRGLALVEKLAERWGCRQVANDGKSVWFALRPGNPPSSMTGCPCPGESAHDPDEGVVHIPASRNAS